MKIQLLKALVVPLKDGSIPVQHKAGEILSVYHRTGRRLIYSLQAKWVSGEEGDPLWTPVVFLRVQPQVEHEIAPDNRMMPKGVRR